MNLKQRRLSALLAMFLLFISQSCNGQIDKRVCLGTDYKFDMFGTTDEHYNQLKEMYSGCEVVLGNLEITHLQPHHDTSFLQKIQEVRGYVLIAVNLVKTIPLINLRIIRGNNLYNNSALYIVSNFNENNITHGLEELPMRQLKEILQGGVTIANNPRLCNLDTINWKDIAHLGHDIDIKQSSLSHCPTCVEDCKGSCWGSGQENCQILTKVICAPECSGRCRGPDPSDCCHSQCAAGCTGPGNTDCLACLKFHDGDTCLESCSLADTFNLRKNLVEAGLKKYSCGSTCVNKCPYDYIVSDSRSCVHVCGFGISEKRENNIHYCKKYDGACEKDVKRIESGQLSPNDIFKQNVHILKTGKETYNVTSKLDRPTVELINTVRNKKVCTGYQNKLSRMFTVDYHYNRVKKMYQGCEILLGNLEITHLAEYHDASFFKDIQEVRGYVLIALNSVKSIPLVNLRIIRGETLLNNASLVITRNYNGNTTYGLEELPMRQLQEIIRGEVRISYNHRLRNLHTIKWDDILLSNYKISVDNCSHESCSECDMEACNGSCWGPGPENCQTLTKLICDQSCPGRCRGPKPSDCCDHKCSAGCKGPKETDCLACNLVRDDTDKCLEFCPPMNTSNDMYPADINVNGNSCVIKCPDNYMLTDSGTCVQNCSQGSYFVEEYGVLRCKKCDGPCPEGKICDGIGYGKLKNAMTINATNIHDFENCNIVLGSIFISKWTIFGDPYTRTPAMDPAKLNILKSVREIKGYLNIQWWPGNFTDLSIFENLEVIRGNQKIYWTYALVVTHVNISSLGLKSLKEVSNGDVVFSNNKNLCYSDTINWTRIFRRKEQKIKISSPEQCAAEEKSCDSSCSDDGCWGPGPSQCFSCHGEECVLQH